MHLLDPSVDWFDGQVIYLDFDGEEDVTYDGPVTVGNVDVPAFAAPGSLAGSEQAVIAGVKNRLVETFADAGVRFVTQKPVDGISYSTIYIGGTDAAFAAYGSFPRLAEKIDVGNKDTADHAFIFSASLAGDGVDDYVHDLSMLIGHETAHLLGYAHNVGYDDSAILGSVAGPIVDQIDCNGGTQSKSINVDVGTTVTFRVNGIFSYNPFDHFDTYWSCHSPDEETEKETDVSNVFNGFWDPEYTRTFSSVGSYQVYAMTQTNNSELDICDHIWAVMAVASEVDVQGNGNSIADGDTSPSTTDGTDFGSADITGGSVTRPFTIRNTGTGTLTVGSVSVSNTTDFSVVGQPSSSVVGSGSTTFQVKFDPAGAGTKAATVSFSNNDSNENPYDFSIQGIGTTGPSVTDDMVNADSPQRSTIFSLSFSFDEDVSASMDLSDLTIYNNTAGTPVDLSGLSADDLTYDGATNTAIWNLSSIAFADGHYTATLSGSGVTDLAGNPLQGGDYLLSFHRMLTDADGNACVDSADLAVWQRNYDPLGRNVNTPATGDWELDGDVDSADLALWQRNYNPLGLSESLPLLQVAANDSLPTPLAQPIVPIPDNGGVASPEPLMQERIVTNPLSLTSLSAPVSAAPSDPVPLPTPMPMDMPQHLLARPDFSVMPMVPSVLDAAPGRRLPEAGWARSLAHQLRVYARTTRARRPAAGDVVDVLAAAELTVPLGL